MRRALVCLIAAVTALTAGLVVPAGAAAVRPTKTKVVVYGDSLTWEARDYVTFLGALGGYSAEVRSFGGTATCDWFNDMRAHLARERPAVVVFAFSGNNLTPCMQLHKRALVGDALAAKYGRDTSSAVSIARRYGARVVLVGAPRSRSGRDDVHWDRIQREYRALAATDRTHVRYADGGKLIAPYGRWSGTRPCLAHERTLVERDGYRPCTRKNRIAVRAPDGAHFCPGNRPANHGVTAGCPRYSSGAFRYATTIVRSVNDTLRALYRR
jgi:hypothetical protein